MEGFKALSKGNPNMNSLVAVGCTTSFLVCVGQPAFVDACACMCVLYMRMCMYLCARTAQI